MSIQQGGIETWQCSPSPVERVPFMLDSHHPTAHKRAVVRTLMGRAETLSSSGVSRVQEKKRIQDSLWRNGYPTAFITKHTLLQQGQWSEEQATRASVTIPYIHGLSQSIRRVLSSLAIKVTFRPLRTLRQELVNPKDPMFVNY